MKDLVVVKASVADFLAKLGRRSIAIFSVFLVPFGVISARRRILDEQGQGTTEYAILVGVLVVMAIVAIALFKPRLQELWTSIAEGINSL